MPLDNYITLSQLTKSVKGLVNKINGEVTVTNSKIGNLTNLNTSAKTDLVAAINEVTVSSGGSDTTQVNADWNATSGVAEILNKPTIPNVPDWALSSSKPTYTAAEVGALPDTTVIPTVPTNVSAFTNDSGYITSYTETDPTVPAWAKAANKPTYTASEVGALPDTTIIPAAQVQSDWNATSGMGVILNKPTIPAATTVTQTLTSGTLIATINGTNIYAPSYTDADGVSY